MAAAARSRRTVRRVQLGGVLQAQLNPVGQPLFLDVRMSEIERRSEDVDAHHGEVRVGPGHRDREPAGAGADVQEPRAGRGQPTAQIGQPPLGGQHGAADRHRQPADALQQRNVDLFPPRRSGRGCRSVPPLAAGTCGPDRAPTWPLPGRERRRSQPIRPRSCRAGRGPRDRRAVAPSPAARTRPAPRGHRQRRRAGRPSPSTRQLPCSLRSPTPKTT